MYRVVRTHFRYCTGEGGYPAVSAKRTIVISERNEFVLYLQPLQCMVNGDKRLFVFIKIYAHPNEAVPYLRGCEQIFLRLGKHRPNCVSQAHLRPGVRTTANLHEFFCG